MRDLSEIRKLLDELEQQPADALEAQDLDFKEWNIRSTRDAVALVVEMAVCMANGGGGTVVFGVNDRAVGRSNAIRGVPPEIDINRLKMGDHKAGQLLGHLIGDDKGADQCSCDCGLIGISQLNNVYDRLKLDQIFISHYTCSLAASPLVPFMS